MLSPKPWRIEAVIQLIAGLFFSLALGVITVSVLHAAGVAAFKSLDGPASILIGTLSIQGVAWILIVLFLKQHELDWRDAFGFRNGNLGKALLLAVVVLALAVPVILSLEYVSALALEKIGLPPEDQRAVELIARAKSWWLRGYLAFFAVVLAPVAEEFIFRGVLFPFVKQLCWPKMAWIGVNLLFALVHFNAPTFLPLFVLALVFTWLYEKTDCLLAPIAAHSLFNTTNLILLFIQTR